MIIVRRPYRKITYLLVRV